MSTSRRNRESSTFTRRSTLTAAGAAALWTALPPVLGPTSYVHGSVFHDRSGDGIRHRGDPGVPGVLVSNGIDVVTTDSEGRWRLPVSPLGDVFVIKPTGWTVPIGGNGLPAFARSLLQNGEDRLDFPLRPSVETSKFEAVLLADTQPQTPRELAFLRDSILCNVSDTGAAFAINHGDVVFDDLTLYPRYLELIRATGMPWHHCPGNHDMNWDPASPDRAFETWRRVFGPCHYAFQHGGATFILLNNVEPLPAGERTPGGYDYRGRIGRTQLAFVRNLLARVARDALIVVSMHIPLVGLETPDEPSAFTADRSELLALLAGRPNTLSLAGHTHTTEHHYIGAEHGFAGPERHHHHVLTAACGGWWSGPYDACGLPVADSRDGTPKGFHVLSVDGSRYTTRFVPVGHAGDAHVRVSIEGRRHWSDASDASPPERVRLGTSLSAEECCSACLVVNVFDGGPRTSVTCELVGATGTRGAELHMQKRGMRDPYIVEVYCRHKPDLKPWLEPSMSSHIWAAPLPANLARGSWRARVSVKDEYGRSSTSTVLFEIVA